MQTRQLAKVFAAWSARHTSEGGCLRCEGPQFPSRRLPRVAQAAMQWAIAMSLNEAGYTMAEDGWSHRDIDRQTATALAEAIAAFMHEHGEALIPWGEDPDWRESGNVGVEFMAARTDADTGQGFGLTRFAGGNPFLGEVDDADVVIGRLGDDVRARLTEAARALGPYRLIARDGALYRATEHDKEQV